MNGIAALLGWNSTLGVLDYFAYIYKGYNVYLFFPIPVFVAYAISGLLFKIISTKFQSKSLIIAGTIGINFFLLYLLFISLVCKTNISLGFSLSLIGAFFLGLTNNLCQLSFFGMMNYFGMETVSKFTIGTAVSGIMVVLLRAIITGIFGDNQDNTIPIVIYFGLSILFY